ncbi:MAG TPA: HAD family hydrolase [Kofleriaceae bacterium]|nr:HAD family hydrolase [Kofleriaceae bacterium]
MSAPSYPPSSFPTLEQPDSAALLARVIELARADGAVVAFDLDSTLLDNRPRQARILREYGAQHRLEALAAHHADHWQGWDARIAMAASGLAPDLIEAHFAPFRAYWRDKFFTSEYCVEDRPIAGAPDYVRAVLAAGARVLYVTGRHEEMRGGTLVCFERTNFPCPDGGAIELLMKPELEEHDDLYKSRTYATLREHGQLVAAFDNEPAHINGYREAFPDALCVHLATDHSMRDIALVDGITSIRDFSAHPAR